jgi:hypothetical protein
VELHAYYLLAYLGHQAAYGASTSVQIEPYSAPRVYVLEYALIQTLGSIWIRLKKTSWPYLKIIPQKLLPESSNSPHQLFCAVYHIGFSLIVE